jgi:hypothetical protein
MQSGRIFPKLWAIDPPAPDELKQVPTQMDGHYHPKLAFP